MPTDIEKFAVELIRTMSKLQESPHVPPEIREIAIATIADADEVLPPLKNKRDLRFNLYLSSHLTIAGWLGRDKERTAHKASAKAATARVTRRAKRLAALVKSSPKYKNIEFKCISDYDKCRKQRGEYSALCSLAFMICIGRRMVPFMK